MVCKIDISVMERKKRSMFQHGYNEFLLDYFTLFVGTLDVLFIVREEKRSRKEYIGYKIKHYLF